MTLATLTIFGIVRLIDLQPEGETGFCMLLNTIADSDFVSELRAELDLQIGGTLGVVSAAEMSVDTLIERLRISSEAVLLLEGFGLWTNDQFSSLDVSRSRLETGAFLLFRVDRETIGRFLDHAPNIRSFLGANIFLIVPDASAMSLEEIADRLDQLRNYYQLSDAQVIERAANGGIPADPEFVEWLILLGRSELVRYAMGQSCGRESTGRAN